MRGLKKSFLVKLSGLSASSCRFKHDKTVTLQYFVGRGPEEIQTAPLPSAWLSSAWSVLGHRSEHGGAGPTAPDGVAGDSACQDLGLGLGLGGSDRQECWPGTGRSRLQHLLSTRVLFRRCTVRPHLSHSWSPDWTAKRRFKGLGWWWWWGWGAAVSPVLSLHTFNDEERDDCLHILLKVIS